MSRRSKKGSLPMLMDDSVGEGCSSTKKTRTNPSATQGSASQVRQKRRSDKAKHSKKPVVLHTEDVTDISDSSNEQSES